MKNVCFALLFAALALGAAWAQARAFSQQQRLLAKPGRILVLVSSSMPLASLKQWSQQARAIGAPLVLRGLVNNSLPATRAWSLAVLASPGGGGPGLEIDPVAFAAYGIAHVPAVVATAGTLRCVANDKCAVPAFDVVHGNMALRQALEIISEQGKAGAAIAQEKLSLLPGKMP